MSNSKRRQLVALLSGVVFALGLGLSGMTDPNKVLNFLDVFGTWDPSLGLVMGGAILAYAPIYRVLEQRDAPKFEHRFHWPTSKDVDLRLVFGSVVFGIGWGLAGYCPGPALVAVTQGSLPILTFVAALVGGMLVQRTLVRRIEHAHGRGH